MSVADLKICGACTPAGHSSTGEMREHRRGHAGYGLCDVAMARVVQPATSGCAEKVGLEDAAAMIEAIEAK